MSKLLIRFWILDADTGKKKLGSPWFSFDEEKNELDEWLDKYGKDHSFMSQTKYVKESK